MNGSDMITFNKAGMKEALQGTEQRFSDYYSPRFYLGEWFPVLLWHNEWRLAFHGKDGDIGLVNNKLWISKGVRLR